MLKTIDTGVITIMRFLLFALAFIITNAVHASTPLPVKKPTTTSFESVLENAVKKEANIPRPPQLAPDLSTVSIIVPPPLPERKRTTSRVPDIARIVDGVPVPDRKPLSIRTTKVNTPSPVPSEIMWSRETNDGRTAGRDTTRTIERTRAKRAPRIIETTEKSPFKTAQLPRASKLSTHDPVIIFFKENTSELEVGQLNIIKSDIISRLQRSPNKKIAVYGYAERNRNNPDKAQKLSLSRALLISEYLADNRISTNRIEARAMGNDTPISPKNRVDAVIF